MTIEKILFYGIIIVGAALDRWADVLSHRLGPPPGEIPGPGGPGGEG
ncbi:MAG: hypothetical protein ACLSHM_01470 [Vescimonas sp.]